MVNDWINPSGLYCFNNNAGTPDIFSHFATGQAILPNSFMGYTQPHTGDRCSGIVTYHQQLANYREYMMVPLTCPLVPGTTYTVSFWTTGGDPVQYIYHSNNIEVYFSTNALSQTGYNVIPSVTPQYTISTLVTNSSWTYYSFQFTPTQAFTYMTIGNFQTDVNTQVQSFGTYRPYAYFFFDDVSVVPSNSSSFLGSDTAFCGNFSHTLNSNDPNTIWSTGVTASQITVTAPGTYWATKPGSCGTATDTIVITQAQPLSPFTLGADTTYCGNFTRVLNNGNASTLWSTGATAAQITVSSAGTYWAMQTNQCNTVSDTIVLSQTTPPQFSLPNDTALCPGDSLQLTVTAGNNISWSTGTITTSIWVTQAGLYWAEAYNVAGCTRRDSIVITQAQPLSPFTLGTDTTYCGSFTRLLSTGNSSTLWSTGTTGAQITVSSAGTYWAMQTNQCSTVSDTIVLSQTTPPQFSLPNDTALCPGDSLQLTVTAGNNISWNTGTTTTSIWVTQAGLYWAEAYNVAGCTRRDSIVITQPSPLSLSIGNDTTYCGNFVCVLSSGNNSTVWSTGITASQITVNTPGLYWASVSNQCYVAGDTITLTQVSPPAFSLPNDTSLCTGDSVQLSIASGNNIVWSNGSTSSSIWVSAPGLYWAEASNVPGCVRRDSIVITQDQIASLNLGSDTTFCSSTGFVLRPGVAGAQYVWNDNSTDSIYVVTQSGTYSVTATNGCGSATDNISITYLPNGCQLAIPTAFSPNGDGKNDLFHAISYCAVPKFTMRVYNRWGELVFETDDIAEGWDGVFRNTQQPMGVFVYYIEYFNDCSQMRETVAGNVTLLR